MTHLGKVPKTPYTSVSDVDAFFERVETIAEPKPPKKIDSTWVDTYGFQTAHSSAIPSMLRWLSVINEDGESTGVWDDLRVDSTRETTLQRLVKEAYSAIFDAVDVQKATLRDLRGAFVSAYSLGVPNRHINCFLALCRLAGIPTAVEAPAREVKQSKPSKPKPIAESNAPSNRRVPSAPGAKQKIPKVRAEGLRINLNVEIPAGWTEGQIRERLATVRRVAAEDEN